MTHEANQVSTQRTCFDFCFLVDMVLAWLSKKGKYWSQNYSVSSVVNEGMEVTYFPCAILDISHKFIDVYSGDLQCWP